MANFDTFQAKSNGARQAFNLLALMRSIYENGKQVQLALALYTAGSDPAFNASVGALFSASERAELNTMATAITALIQDWEQNHSGAISGS